MRTSIRGSSITDEQRADNASYLKQLIAHAEGTGDLADWQTAVFFASDFTDKPNERVAWRLLALSQFGLVGNLSNQPDSSPQIMYPYWSQLAQTSEQTAQIGQCITLGRNAIFAWQKALECLNNVQQENSLAATEVRENLNRATAWLQEEIVRQRSACVVAAQQCVVAAQQPAQPWRGGMFADGGHGRSHASPLQPQQPVRRVT